MSTPLVAGLAIAAALVAPAWAAPQASGVQASDEAMTCEQIAAELVPYMQQVAPNVQALAVTQQREFEQAQAKHAAREPAHLTLAGMAAATTFDPTGASQRAYTAAVMAQMAKERAEDRAEAASPQAQKAKAQREQIAAQAQTLQADARLQRLMQLGQQKGCDRKR
jgi:hypothetical protein